MAKQTMGEFLATLRKANGYTQQEVAEKLNISNRTLSSWETDRTVPDVLLLPAVADLYGVTVDELVRGERIIETAERSEISDKAYVAVRKNRFGKFSAKCALLSGLALLCASLFVVAGIIATLTDSTIVLDVILLILTAAGFVTCVVLLLYFFYATKSAEGIVLSEDLTEDKKAYLIALKHKAAKFLAINSIPFAVGVLLFTYIYVSHTFENSLDYAYPILTTSAAILTVCIIATFALLVTAVICGNIHFTKLASVTQLKIHKTNKKYALILFIIGAAAGGILVICLIAAAILYDRNGEYLEIGFGYLTPVIPAICAIIYFAIRKKQNYNF